MKISWTEIEKHSKDGITNFTVGYAKGLRVAEIIRNSFDDSYSFKLYHPLIPKGRYADKSGAKQAVKRALNKTLKVLKD